MWIFKYGLEIWELKCGKRDKELKLTTHIDVVLIREPVSEDLL